MKSITRASKAKKYFVVVSIVAIIAAVSGIAYWKMTSSDNKQPTNNEQTDSSQTPATDTPPTEAEKSAGSSQKQDTVNRDQNNTTPESNFAVTITAANQNGSVLNIRSLIDFVSSDGKCTLTLTKGNATVTKTSTIQALAGSSTCRGFDIPVSELSKGTWQAVLTVTIGSSSGQAKRDITVS